MKTIELKLYSFNELSEDAQKHAIEQYREGQDFSHLWNEARKTAEAMHEMFMTNEGRNSWLEFSTRNIDDNVMNLKGQRLRTWILNNYGGTLYQPKYIGSINNNNMYTHPRIKSKKLSNGNVFNPYYSAILKDNCCVLTGMYYDDEALKPIYAFIDNPDGRDLEDIISDCFNALKKAIESEEESLQTDEAITEELKESGDEFTENGEKY